MENKNIKNRIWIAALSFISIITTGVVGYMLIEGYSFRDALYMTFITISTVGFGLIKPLSSGGVYFTIFLIITSFILIAFIVQSVISILINTDFLLYLKKKRWKKL